MGGKRGACRLVLVALLLSLVACSEPAPKRSGQDTFIRRAIFAEHSLWLLSDAGALFTVKEGGSAAVPVQERVLDLWRREGSAFTVSCVAANCSTWVINRWASGQAEAGATVAARGEDLIAAGSTETSIFLLTNRRIVEIRGGKTDETRLEKPIEADPVAAVLFTGRGIYLGLNAGEWGGGLKFIERVTGRITTIEKNASKSLCGGPLNTGCDPVTGLAVVPWKPDCIAASVGLVHFSPHGRIVEVCGTNVERLYFRPFGGQSGTDESGEPFSTVAFFGLNAQAGALWAAGIDGIYQIEKDGARFRSLPEFRKAGDFTVSFSDPRIILVLTDINQRRSISGSVPLLVPR